MNDGPDGTAGDDVAVGDGRSLEEPDLRTVLRSVADAVLVHDPAGEITAVNGPATELFDRPRATLRGTNVADLAAPDADRGGEALPERLRRVGAGGRETCEWPVGDGEGDPLRAAASATPVAVEGERRLLSVLRPVEPPERYGRGRAEERDGHGRPANVHDSDDVTDRGRRERELKALTTRLELALAETDTGVWEHDLRTDEVLWDETMERLFGFEPGEFSGDYATARERIHPEDREAVDARIDEAAAAAGSDEPYRVEFRVEYPGGETRWMQSRGVVRGDGDERLRMVGVQTDITDRKRAERELRERNERLELLNRIVRHDIRNDMEVVRSCAGVLEERIDADRTTVHDRLDELTDAAEHAVELTETVRDLLRATDEDGVEPVPLGPTLRDELDALRSTEGVTVEAPDELPTTRVLADDTLGTLFRNLLSNAVRHNDREEPTVTVTVSEDDERVVVRVGDDGPGVPEARREEVFARGERGLESPGSGLGLYLVDRLVRRYGGDVWIEDNDPRGAVFAVELRRASWPDDSD